jgi:hypothetical protein
MLACARVILSHAHHPAIPYIVLVTILVLTSYWEVLGRNLDFDEKDIYKGKQRKESVVRQLLAHGF